MFSKVLSSEIIDFLYQNDEFCMKLGKIMLSIGKLEEQLALLLANNETGDLDVSKPNMGMLIKYIENKKFFPALVSSLYKLNENNINSLVIIVVEKSIININNLEEKDIKAYIKRVVELESKVDLIYNIIKEHNKISV